MFNIVLLEPRIAGNVGTIGRFCYNLGFNLHIVGPHLLDYSDKKLMRAGLDYWWKLKPNLYENSVDFLNSHKNHERFFFASTKAQRYFCDEINYQIGDYFIFGSETYGIFQDEFLSIMTKQSENIIKIPQKSHGRSLNLALSVASISTYALSQNIKKFEIS